MVKLLHLPKCRILVVLIVIVLQLFFSCDSVDKRNMRLSSRAQFETFYNKEVFFPDTLHFLDPQTGKSVASDDIYMRRPCIVSIIDADCDACIVKIADWKQFISTSGDIKIDDLFLILQTTNPAYFIDRYKNILDPDLNLLLDSGYFLIRTNKIPGEQHFRTFLLDRNNRIRLLGDPTKSLRLTNLYNETFKKIKNEN